MKTNSRAIIFPKDKNCPYKPISINYHEGKELKVTNFFRKLVSSAVLENPPRIYKQIIFFYINGELKYLKPFNI
jgi:hypothetical protein